MTLATVIPRAELIVDAVAEDRSSAANADTLGFGMTIRVVRTTLPDAMASMMTLLQWIDSVPAGSFEEMYEAKLTRNCF